MPSAPTSRVHFIRAFLASALGTGLSRILGAGRDIALAGVLGAGVAADTFIIAWTIPNILRRYVADEGLTGATVPALAKAEAEEGSDAAALLASRLLGALVVANLLLVLAGILLAEPLVLAFAWSWRDDPVKYDLTVSMTRWLMPFCALVSIVSFFEGLLNLRGHFFVPKIAPGVVSACIIGTLLLAADVFEQPVWAAVFGVLAGGVLHVLVHLPILWKRWGPVPLKLAASPRVRAVAIEMGKVVVIGVFAQLNIVVLRQLATALPAGSVSQYQYGTRVVDLAQGVVAVAIGSALLPNISAAVSEANWDAFRDDLQRAVRLACFLLVPVAAGLAAFAVPISAALFRHGQYTWADTLATASVVQLMVPCVLFFAGVNIIKRAYFALDDRATLLAVGGTGVAATGALGWVLLDDLGVSGIALALTLSTGLQLAAYVVLLSRQVDGGLGLGALLGPLARIAVASVPPVVVLVLLAPRGDWARGPLDPWNLGVLVTGIATSAAVYLTAAHLLGVQEVSRVVARLRARLGR